MSRASGARSQVTANQESQEVHQDPRGIHKEDSVATRDAQQLEMVDLQLSQYLYGENILRREAQYGCQSNIKLQLRNSGQQEAADVQVE